MRKRNFSWKTTTSSQSSDEPDETLEFLWKGAVATNDTKCGTNVIREVRAVSDHFLFLDEPEVFRNSNKQNGVTTHGMWSKELSQGISQWNASDGGPRLSEWPS